MAGFLGLAVSGCVSTQSTQSAELPEAENHAAHDAGVGAVQTIYYRAGEGFVPARLDVETGTRVVLVNESAEQLAPRFGVAQGDSHSAEETGHHGAHSQGHHSDAPAWKSDDPHPDGHGRGWDHAFNVSGYWRYHNHQKPEPHRPDCGAGPGRHEARAPGGRRTGSLVPRGAGAGA